MESKINVCIIEDEPQVSSAVTDYLVEEGVSVTSFVSAEDFYDGHSKEFRGIYLIDWNLPGDPGIDVIKFIKSYDEDSAVFLVTGYSSDEDVIQGLNSGADDYIKKPFNLQELLIRVKNAGQRLNQVSKRDQGSNSSVLELIPAAFAFNKNGQVVKLTEREYIIFETLQKQYNEAVSRDDLINAFALNKKMVSRNIDVHIFSLRKKIKVVDMYIDTVWNFGYKLT